MRRRFRENPGTVDEAWARYFAAEDSGEPAGGTPGGGGHAPSSPTGQNPPSAAPQAPASTPSRPTPPATVAAAAAPAAVPTSVATVERAAAPHHDTAPESPGSGKGVSPDRPRPSHDAASPDEGEAVRTKLRGAAARVVQNMDASLKVPTATSVREVPMKLVAAERQIINEYLSTSTGGKVSYTHLIGFAMVQALKALPAMNNFYDEADGQAFLVTPATINLGLAIDVAKPDGTRQLLVPNIRDAGSLDFAQFWHAYELIVHKARRGELTAEDFKDTTATLTNPGTIGTTHSVARLLRGQGVIVGVGSIDYPAEFQGAAASYITRFGVSQVSTLTSTYDHRIIQGALSGEFLAYIGQLLLGNHEFYDRVFAALRIPYEPVRWMKDISDENPSRPRISRIAPLIAAYRNYGHYMADIDPLEFRQRTHPELAIEYHGLTLWDLDRVFPIAGLGAGSGGTKTMHEILSILRSSYCRTVGLEYMHIADNEQRTWIQERFERPYARWPKEEHLRILDKLSEAEIFETFLQTKYVGQTRFSLEGAESAIVFLDELCEQSADAGIDEVVIGMPHRGRLNVLANIIGKSYTQLFEEFEGNANAGDQSSGDVKYHLGAEGEFVAASGNTVTTSLAANPSHLETVNPVVEGIARAKLDDLGGQEDEYGVLPVLMHGDAAFAGQGVVYETMQMSQLRAYKTGGTIHLVINNQVGFTAGPTESRSSVYCTDVAKAWQCPIFHVNGDDPEAIARVAQVAFEYRQKFHKDVVIDLVCYRRRGHNEGDDPSFTQPKMYDLITQKRTTRTLYTEALIGRGDITVEEAQAVISHFRNRLEGVFQEVREAGNRPSDPIPNAPSYPAKAKGDPNLLIDKATMDAVAKAHLTFPDGFTVHPKVLPRLKQRADSLSNGGIDWATAELLAFGSLLLEGRSVRLVGQDTRRGTFSQRFAAVVDRVTNEEYVPLKHLSDTQGSFYVYDALLSEYAAMGFEYGYSLAQPNALVCWEAQYGDFINGAQTIIDEYVSSGDAKWGQKSGVVLLLPHGYEGAGPDHSSARLERWLAQCSERAMAVCQPSTPASYFYLLRQHAYVNRHRPLVVMTPKSMLRNKLAVSAVDDFTNGRWRPVLPDPTIEDPSTVERVLLCAGKIRWDLVNARAAAGLEQKVAIIALERFYPLPAQELAAELEPYRHVTDIRYVQEEPVNQGAWWFLQRRLSAAMAVYSHNQEFPMTGIARPEASAPAVGSAKAHAVQAAELIHRALAPLPEGSER